MIRALKQASELEMIGLKRSFEIQRDSWRGGGVDEVSLNHGVNRRDVEAIRIVQGRMQKGLPSSVRVAAYLPWTLDPERLDTSRIVSLFEKSMSRLRNHRIMRRNWLEMSPAISPGGMKLANADRLLSILPDGAMRGATVSITGAPSRFIDDQATCIKHVAGALSRHVGDDIKLDPGIKAFEDEFRIRITRADVDGAIDYAACAVAAGIVAMIHYKAVCLLHATASSGQSEHS